MFQFYYTGFGANMLVYFVNFFLTPTFIIEPLKCSVLPHRSRQYKLALIFLQKIRIHSCRCSSFIAKGHIRVGYSVVRALIAPLAHYQPFASAPPAHISKWVNTYTSGQTIQCLLFFPFPKRRLYLTDKYIPLLNLMLFMLI